MAETDGLPAAVLGTYNAMPYAWLSAALWALLRETPRGARRWAVAGMVMAYGMRNTVYPHMDWVRSQAVTDPRWWNRGLAVRG
ncbi:MAG: hypothetical protein M3042_08480 [Actinomycetota bacterium]|nr:hypothetical protein [Actinomycetota bacterium]